MTPASAEMSGASVTRTMRERKLQAERTPTAVLGRGKAAREGRGVDVAVVGVTGREGGLPDDELVEVNAGRVDLEERRVRPCAA